MWLLVLEPFLYLFSSKNAIFHKFLYRTFWYSRNYTYFYFPKWRYKPRMVLKITNLHILRYLPTCWLYLLECYTIDNQRCTHTYRKVSLRYTFMEKQLGWSDCFLPVPAGNQKNNLYYKSHWKPEWKNQKVHEIKAFIPFGWCSQKDRLSFTYGDWEEMDPAYS